MAHRTGHNWPAPYFPSSNMLSSWLFKKMFTSALLTFRDGQFFVGGGVVSSIFVLHPLDTSSMLQPMLGQTKTFPGIAQSSPDWEPLIHNSLPVTPAKMSAPGGQASLPCCLLWIPRHPEQQWAWNMWMNECPFKHMHSQQTQISDSSIRKWPVFNFISPLQIFITIKEW